MLDLGLLGGWAAGGPVADAGIATKTPAGVAGSVDADTAALAGAFRALVDAFATGDAAAPAQSAPHAAAMATPALAPTPAQMPAPVAQPALGLTQMPTPVALPAGPAPMDAAVPVPDFLQADSLRGHRGPAFSSAVPAATADADPAAEVAPNAIDLVGAVTNVTAADAAPIAHRVGATITPVREIESDAAPDEDETTTVVPVLAKTTPEVRPFAEINLVEKTTRVSVGAETTPEVNSTTRSTTRGAGSSKTAPEVNFPAEKATQENQHVNSKREMTTRGSVSAETTPEVLSRGHGAADLRRFIDNVAQTGTVGGDDSGSNASAGGDLANAGSNMARAMRPARVQETVARFASIQALAPLPARAVSTSAPAVSDEPAPPKTPVVAPPAATTATATSSTAAPQPVTAWHSMTGSSGVIARPAGPESQTPMPSAEHTAPQIVSAIRLAWSRGVGEAHIRLDPNQFGDLSVSLRVESGQVVARLQADSPEVREWLQSNQRTLQQGLAEHNLKLDRFEVAAPREEARDTERRDARENREQADDRQQRRQKRSGADAGFEFVA